MLKLENITKDYVVNKDLTVHALKGVSVNFRSNEFVSILGPSGCGKTTLLNIIGGLDHYTSGDLNIDGTSTKNFVESDWNRYRNGRVGFVFQSYNLIPHQSVLENVELALTISGLSKQQRRQMAKEALVEVGLEREISKRPNQLSGGQMQRVAIARALVNKPQIVLADEPTGALDSVTSLQVMELLKKVAKTHLVILVTHNSALAEQYSTRIIKLLDGEVQSDSKPYELPQEQPQEKDKTPKQKQKRVGMSFFTALNLSFKNLLTKKGRTVMTSFAGSIGIIGVALVLALSNGFNNYIAKLQSDTLSGFPISISNFATDYQAVFEQQQASRGQSSDEGRFPDDQNIKVYSPQSVLAAGIHFNDINQEYLSYIRQYQADQMAKNPADRQINDVSYSYASKLSVFTDNNGSYKVIDTSSSSSMMALFSGGGSGVFQEALNNSQFVTEQYDVLYGKYPTQHDEVAIIVDSRNRISAKTLDALGISYQQHDEGYDDISFADIVNSENPKSFYLISHGDYYIADGEMYKTFENYHANDLQTALHNVSTDSDTIKLNVVGVLRVNADSALELYDTGILYLPTLTEKYLADSKNSDFFNAQKNAKTQNSVYVGSSGVFSKVPIAFATQALNNTNSYGIKFTEAQAYNLLWQETGTSDLPTTIYIYPKDFASKELVVEHLDAYNHDRETEDSIFYTDAAAILSSSMGQMIDIISYVLIAFAAISLLVSSVMIGIITYVSVIERTKEIGVLRSLGASKNDVSNVFNAETFLIGLTAGLIGVLVTYVLCIPINAILIAVANGTLTTNLALLNPFSALILVGISCMLTLVGGAIPARFAAKLDPVKALRAE